MRDAVHGLSIMKRIVRDIRDLLDEGKDVADEGAVHLGDEDHLGLWDEKMGEVAAGRLYADEWENPVPSADQTALVAEWRALGMHPWCGVTWRH